MTIQRVRRGLPRVTGGEPWPPVGPAAVADAAPRLDDAAFKAATAPTVQQPAAAAETPATSALMGGTAGRTATVGGRTLRRGLPRLVAGEPWPPADVAPTPVTPSLPVAAPAPPRQETAATASLAESSVAVTAATSETPAGTLAAAAETTRPGRRFAALPRSSRILLGVAGLFVVGGLIVVLARWLLGTPSLQAFIAEYPGETPLPDGAPVGLPVWLGWQHFFNVFLMVLIIRSGLGVRREKRPPAYWASKRRPQHKIGLTLWFHQSLDLLWLINGAIFVVLLFVTGQWMRIVPTSWDVFPNALSAALQYASFAWPTENGWVNYNSLQVLAYFVTVFLAAPLAAISGVRMSDVWPQQAKRLSAAYPVEWARSVHFPVMLYFCGFIVVHVVLVFATGALRNLNHMYGGQDAVDWTGFWIFAASIALIAAAWALARPLVLAPIARLFGSVTAR